MFTITTTAGHVLGTSKGSRWDDGAISHALNGNGLGVSKIDLSHANANLDLSHANLEGGVFTSKSSDYSYSRMEGTTIKDATGSKFAGNVAANFTGDCNSMDFIHACMYGCSITSAKGMWDGGFTKNGLRVIYYRHNNSNNDLWINVSVLPEWDYTGALLSAPLAFLEDAVADLEQAQRIDVLAHVALTLSRNIARSVTTTGDLAALDMLDNSASVNPIAEKAKEQAPPVAVKAPAKVAPKIEPKPSPAPLASVADLPADIVGQLEAEMANLTQLAAAASSK